MIILDTDVVIWILRGNRSMIAATAKIHQATLATMNVKHFPMDDIKLLKQNKNFSP